MISCVISQCIQLRNQAVMIRQSGLARNEMSEPAERSCGLVL